MKRIMFVCHGNICRSPMAEFIFKKMLEENGLSSEIFVSSSATSSEEIYRGVGNPVYPPAVRELAKHGIPCQGKRAIQLKKEDYDKYDIFLCMDYFNVLNTLKIFGNDEKEKVKKLLDLTENGGDVADPWYTGDFEATYKDIYRGCTALLNLIMKK